MFVAIAGFDAKYFFRTWRPRTAIPRAAEDGNPETDTDPAWTPLLSVNHPEYPSGHASYSTALTDAVAVFFGTDKVEVRTNSSRNCDNVFTLPKEMLVRRRGGLGPAKVAQFDRALASGSRSAGLFEGIRGSSALGPFSSWPAGPPPFTF